VLMTALDLPLNIESDKTGALENFLGAGVPAGNFAFGVTGYLDLITTATAALVAAVGGTGGIPGLDDQINAVKTQIDNGGDCLTTSASPADNAAAAFLDMLHSIYASAPGTLLNPALGQTIFTTDNLITTSALTAGGASLPSDIGGLLPGFKFLYPIDQAVPGFTLSNATPRIDGADPAFVSQFELIPKLAPDGATADDGQITFAEVLCAAG
ncbi:MAG: hypothetical protein O7A08_08335, partial [SAR324 cluster bacterium]|nr:hypothetical protein [SAR324 cluster bacterium]